MGFANDDIDRLLAETARRCALCSTVHYVQVHHVVPLKDGGTDDIGNAIPLCPNCHAQVHASAAPGCTTRGYTAQELRLHLERAKKRAQTLGKDDVAAGVSVTFESRSYGGFDEVNLGPEFGPAFQKSCQFLLTFANAMATPASVPSMLLRHEILSEDVVRLRRDKARFAGANVGDQLFIRLTNRSFDGWWLINDRHFASDPHRPLCPNEPELFLSPNRPPLKYDLEPGEIVSIYGSIWAEYAALHSVYFEILTVADGKTTRACTEALKILDDGIPQ